MSRMDILTNEELKNLINNSSLKPKYNEVIDRESAYEILTAKVQRIQNEEAKNNQEKNKKTESGTVTSTRKSTAQNPIIKLLTSATFIRGVFGVLSKVLKK